MIFASRPYALTNKIQPYEWGERGGSAYIARLLGLQNVEKDRPFAELWMGTHPLGTSTVEDGTGGQLPLSELVERYPQQVLGERVAAAFANRLPFLLKVLSASEPLSIQLHPSKTQAAGLHAKDPAHYPDDNHKPEIAIALESLHALAGLRDDAEIERLLNAFPALRDFVTGGASGGRSEPVGAQRAFLSLMRQAVEEPGKLGAVIDSLASQLERKKRRDYSVTLFLELLPKYPGDVGLLSIFFLRLRRLQKGQAMFIPAGVPHAYLKGNIVECMASSDNVIRAGLTPKFKDIPALLEVASDGQPEMYSPATPDFLYSPPVREFRVGRRQLRAGQALTDRNDGVRILLVLQGRLRLAWAGGRLDAARGQSILLPGSLGEAGIECLEAAELYTADVP